MGSRIEGSALKGNQAQGSIGQAVDGNICSRQRTRWWSKALRSRIVTLETAERHHYGKARTAVTQHGYQRGKSFEGYEVRA